MTTATISSRGQIVIPSAIRKMMGFRAGDQIAFSIDPQAEKVTIERVESIEEMRERLTAMIKPGTVPLEDTRSFFNQRPPRL